jgi:hypothetical protein
MMALKLLTEISLNIDLDHTYATDLWLVELNNGVYIPH